MSHDDFDIDLRSLAFVVVDDPYRTDYAGAVVLDLGAHKGYYGAYAFAHGARTVISLEPERANVELLERAARSHGTTAWHVREAAIGATSGTAELHVMGASWGHALHPPEHWAKHEVGRQLVRVEALTDVLAEVEEIAAQTLGARIVVKLNVEGGECDTVLGTRPSAWEACDEVFVETHGWAPCGADELAEHLASAGLKPVESSHRLVLRLRREAEPPADRRSDPS